MKRLSCLAAVLVALCVSVVSAAEPIFSGHCEGGHVVLDFGDGVPEDGCYTLCTEKGEITICPAVRLTVGPSPKPVPGPDPKPEPVNEFAKSVVAAVNKIPVSDKRHELAMKLSAVYNMLSQQVQSGGIHPTNAVQAADLLCMTVLGGEKNTWAGVTAIVNAAVSKAGTAEATALVLTQAGDAVLSTVPASGDLEQAAARYGFDWTTFMAFLMELLKILLPLIIS